MKQEIDDKILKLIEQQPEITNQGTTLNNDEDIRTTNFFSQKGLI